MLPKSKSLVFLALLISAVVLIAAAAGTHFSLLQLTEARNDTARSRDTIRELHRTVSTLLDAETGQRGYLLTGRKEYLVPYLDASNGIQTRLTELDVLISGADTKTDLLELRGAIAEKLGELAETIRLHDSGDHAAALRLVMSDAGKRSMDQIRLIGDRMERAESARYVANVGKELHARRVTLASAWATSALAMGLLAMLYLVVRRDAAQLRASELQLSITLRSIGDAVIATDADGRITLMNPVAERLTGWAAAAARNKPLEDVFRIINEQSRAVVESPVTKVLRAGMVVGLANHTLLIRRDGIEAPIADSGAPITDDQGKIVGVVLVFRDASQERDLQRSMREADRRKDEFLATLSHELRNPLAPIRQAVAVIRAPAATEKQVRWSVEVIERQVQNMARLLDDLLDVSRITRGTLEVRRSRVSLSSVLDAAVELARPAIDAKHHVLRVDSAADAFLDADPLRLAQVIANLLTNAAKYTDPHGRIQVRAEFDGSQLQLTVTDTGVGLSQDMLERIFEMFVQVDGARDRADGGLGIGLALAKGLVELHGGGIVAQSEGLGRGSEFVVRLPLAAPAPLPDEADHPTEPRPTFATRFLIADDNVDGAESLAALLRLYGHEVQVVHDGEAALQALEGSKPEFALLDIGMPRLNGHQVATRTRATAWGKSITLVALTGWGQESDRSAALAAGFDHHFVKPVDTETLLAALLSRTRTRLSADSAQG